MESLHVLVVEDDEVYGPALCRALHRAGYETTRLTTLSDALAYDGVSPLALVDLGLPDGSGVEIVRHLSSRSTRVVVLTGHGSIPAAVQCMQEGAVDFLTKPVSTVEITTALEGAVVQKTPVDGGSERLDEVERAHILAVLQACDGNVSEAARRLGLYRRTLQRKLQKL